MSALFLKSPERCLSTLFLRSPDGGDFQSPLEHKHCPGRGGGVCPCTEDEPACPLLFASITRPLGTWKSIKKVVMKVAEEEEKYQEERQGVK